MIKAAFYCILSLMAAYLLISETQCNGFTSDYALYLIQRIKMSTFLHNDEAKFSFSRGLPRRFSDWKAKSFKHV